MSYTWKDALSKIGKQLNDKVDLTSSKINDKFMSELENIFNDSTLNQDTVILSNKIYQLTQDLSLEKTSKISGLNNSVISGNYTLTFLNNDVEVKNIIFDGLNKIVKKDVNGRIKFINCTFNNFSKVGVFAQNQSNVVFIDCKFSNIGLDVSGNDINYLGGLIYAEGCDELSISNLIGDKSHGQGAIRFTRLKKLYLNNVSINNTYCRAVSGVVETGYETTGYIINSDFKNIGVLREGNSGVGCNAIYTTGGYTSLDISFNTFENIVENAIESRCLRIFSNTFKNIGIMQDTLPTPSVEGIWANAKIIENNTFINVNGFPINRSLESNECIFIKGNTFIKGDISSTDTAISMYDCLSKDLYLNNNSVIGYDYLFNILNTNSEFNNKIKLNNNNSDINLLKGNNYNNLFLNCDNNVKYPINTVDEFVSQNIFIKNNIKTITSNGNTLSVIHLNQYDCYLAKEFNFEIPKIIEYSAYIKGNGKVRLRLVPFINGIYDYSKAFVVEKNSNGEFVFIHSVSIIQDKFKIEFLDLTNVSDTEFLIKDIEIKYLVNK